MVVVVCGGLLAVGKGVGRVVEGKVGNARAGEGGKGACVCVCVEWNTVEQLCTILSFLSIK